MSATGTASATKETLGDLRRALGEMLGAERRLRSRDKVSEDGLTVGQIRALMCLKDKQEATAGELAKFADLNPASMTAMLDHLEAADVILRERSVSDRRVVNVSLTEHGRALVQKRLRLWEARWRDVFSDVSDDDLATATRVMHSIANMFDDIAPQHH